MKSYAIVGQANTHDSYVLCLHCYNNSLAGRTEDFSAWQPIFASDEGWRDMTCDDCLKKLEDTI